MGNKLKQSMKAVLAVLAGVLLTTGGVSWVEAESSTSWHHGHTVYAYTNSEADGTCAYIIAPGFGTTITGFATSPAQGLGTASAGTEHPSAFSLTRNSRTRAPSPSGGMGPRPCFS